MKSVVSQAVCWAPDGRRVLVGGADGSVSVFTVGQTQGALETRWSCGPNPVDDLRCLGPLVLTRQAWLVQVWDPRAPQSKPLSLPGGAASFDTHPSDEDLVALGTTDSRLVLWSRAGGVRFTSRQLEGGNGLVATQFSPDGRRVWTLAAWGRTVYEFDVARRRLVAQYPLGAPPADEDSSPEVAVRAARLDARAGRVALWEPGARTVQLFDVVSGARLATHEDPRRGRTFVAFHPVEALLARSGGEATEVFTPGRAAPRRLEGQPFTPPRALARDFRVEAVGKPVKLTRRAGPVAWSPAGDQLVHAVVVTDVVALSRWPLSVPNRHGRASRAPPASR